MVTKLGLVVVVAAIACACAGSPIPSASTPATGPIASTPESTATASQPNSPQPAITRHVVIDTDMAPDDWIAILYLLQRPDITIDAITVTGTGEAHCGPGVQHAGGLVALAGQPDIPIACGRETPLGGDHAFPDPWREEVDTLLGLRLPDGSTSATEESAPDLLVRLVGESGDPVTILTLGPLTNVAEALGEDPSLAHKIEAIYIMGGAVEVFGNVGHSLGIENQYAEWNIYCDPQAAKMVLESGVPVTIIPLDATNDVAVSEAFVDELRASAETDAAEFVLAVLDIRMPFIQSGTYYFWDPLAAAVLVDESLTTFQTASLTVETGEGPDSGRIVPAAAGPITRYADSGDRDVFEQELIDALNGL